MVSHDGSNEVEQARMSALTTIDSLNNFIDEIESGKSSGRVYSKLIHDDPINAALDTISEYREIAAMYNEKIDNKVIEKMEQAKIDLISILNASNDPDIDLIWDSLPSDFGTEQSSPIDEVDSDNPFKKISRKNTDTDV